MSRFQWGQLLCSLTPSCSFSLSLSLSLCVCSKSLNPDLRSGTHIQSPYVYVCVSVWVCLRSHLGSGCLFNANFEDIKIVSAQKYATHYAGLFVRPEKWAEHLYVPQYTKNTYILYIHTFAYIHGRKVNFIMYWIWVGQRGVVESWSS